MFNTFKIVLWVAVVLGAASAAMGATKHPPHQHRAAAWHQPAGASAFGYARFGNTYPASVLEALKREAAGDRRCWGGNCDPVSGEGTIAN